MNAIALLLVQLGLSLVIRKVQNDAVDAVQKKDLMTSVDSLYQQAVDAHARAQRKDDKTT